MREPQPVFEPDTPAPRDMEMRAFPLGFRDKEVENAFRDNWTRTTRRDHVLWTAASTISYAIISVLLWIAAEPGFVEFQWFRLFICIPVLFAAWALLVSSRFTARLYNRLFVFKNVAIYGNAVISYALADAGDYRMYLFESCLLFVFIQGFYPARWSTITVFTVIGTLIATVSLIHADSGPAAALVHLEMVLLVTYGLAATCNFASYSKEVLSRRTFRSVRTLSERQKRSDKLTEEATRAAESKSRFLAIAAHELRTPLNAMIGFTELVEMTRDTSRAPTTFHDRFAVIGRDANHLSQLAETTLKISQDGRESLSQQRQFFQIENLLAEIAADFSLVAQGSHVGLASPDGSSGHVITGDPAVVKTLIECLVRRVRSQNVRCDTVELGFEQQGEAGFLLTVRPRNTTEDQVGWEEKVVALIEPATNSDSERGLSSGLVTLFAQSQGATVLKIDREDHELELGIAFPLELVAPLSTSSFASPTIEPTREAC
jgi:signal transduction histidine kinase